MKRGKWIGCFFFFSSRRRHTRLQGDWSSDVCSSDLVVAIDVPPLRDRPDDIVTIAQRLLAFFNRQRKIVGFADEALAALRSYRWPGNVRELRNVIERAVILCQGERIGVEHLPVNFAPQPRSALVGDLISLDQLEEARIRRVLAATKSLDEAAQVLGIDSATLYRKRKKYGI